MHPLWMTRTAGRKKDTTGKDNAIARNVEIVLMKNSFLMFMQKRHDRQWEPRDKSTVILRAWEKKTHDADNVINICVSDRQIERRPHDIGTK